MRSDLMTKGVQRIPHRALFKALGLTDEELSRPIIGIVNARSEIIPGHIHLNIIAQAVKDGIRMAGGTPIEFPSIGVCDGIAMNHAGMFYSLPSREHIADSVEIMATAHPFDGLVFIPNCDKIVPGMLMAAMRLNLPSIFVSGGPMLPGRVKGKKVALTDAFEAPGAMETGRMDLETVREIEENSCPGCGSCAGMFTANSMNCMCELLGIALPGNGTIPAVYAERIRLAKHTGMRAVELVKENIHAQDILTPSAFENGLVADMAMGCSTNTLLHLPAIAHEGGMRIDLRHVNEISERVPHIVKMNPAGSHFLVDLYEAGGLQAVLRRLNEMGLLHADAMTVNGKTVAENATMAQIRNPEVIRSRDTAYSQTGGLAVLWGNLCPDGAVVKHTVVPKEMFSAVLTARPFDCEEDALNAVLTHRIRPGDAVIIRYEGPKGSGMPEMFYTTEAIASDPLLASTIALLTDGRFSGASKGPAVGHISPEAAEGGPIALVEEGDLIELDIEKRVLRLIGVKGQRMEKAQIEEVLRQRKAAWTPPESRYEKGVLKQFASLAVSPMKGGYMDG